MKRIPIPCPQGIPGCAVAHYRLVPDNQPSADPVEAARERLEQVISGEALVTVYPRGTQPTDFHADIRTLIDDTRAHVARLTRELSESRARAVQGEQVLAQGEASDGYHTHRELYEYRMLYNAHAARGWLAAGVPVVKSWRHSDGEPCFGGGWFIVVAQLPSGQVSNHYRDEFWPLFDVPEVETPPEYDGHTPSDAAVRLREALPRTSTPGDANGQ